MKKEEYVNNTCGDCLTPTKSKETQLEEIIGQFKDLYLNYNYCKIDLSEILIKLRGEIPSRKEECKDNIKSVGSISELYSLVSELNDTRLEIQNMLSELSSII